jgi:hypothetical protein
MEYQKEVIPDEDNVYRNVPTIHIGRWVSSRQPKESDFTLREGEIGLSVNWDKYCTLNEAFVKIGLERTPKNPAIYRNPKDFKVIKINVGDLRKIKLLSEVPVTVIHDPIDIPVANRSHSLICSEDQDEFRLKLCDLISSFEDIFENPNFEEVDAELVIRRSQ